VRVEARWRPVVDTVSRASRSTRVFHSSQAGHCPSHFGSWCPQAVHWNTRYFLAIVCSVYPVGVFLDQPLHGAYSKIMGGWNYG
jgi:hypothetical protein